MHAPLPATATDPGVRPGPAAFEGDRPDAGLRWWDVAGAVAGSTLLLVTALRQPYSYDEIQQITPYGSDSVPAIVGGTRQPPLDPLLGGLFTHLFGEGQLQQRLVPLLAGIGVLVLTGLLLRRLGFGAAGTWAVWVLATAPLAVRYGAYTRPYALPLLWMLLFAYATARWFEDRRRLWLAVLAFAAVALPLTRVPEPCVFLAVTTASLSFFSWHGRLRWRDTRPVVAVSGAALLLLGVPMFLILGARTEGSFFDPSPAGVVGRAGRGFHEIATAAIPLLGSSFPWWPLTLAVLVVGIGCAAARRRLFGWPLWWPFLAAPVAFLLAYHLVNPFSFFSLPYRSRAAYFFVPGYVLVTAAVASLVTRRRLAVRWRAALAVLLGAALVSQLPDTAAVVADDAAPDFGRISQVLATRLPADAIVLYDRPTPAGQSRQPFLGRPRYLGDTPYVATLAEVGTHADDLPRTGPVYMLLNGQCARPGRCVLSRKPWTHPVTGWRLLRTDERFSLYAPADGQAGVPGVVDAMTRFGQALGPDLGYVETLNAAALLAREGRSGRAAAMVRRLRGEVSPLVNDRIGWWVRSQDFPVPH